MNENKLLALALAAASGLTTAQAQTWETVDVTPSIPTVDVIAGPGAAVFTLGNIYSADGTATGTSSVRRSLDQGATWTTIATLPCVPAKLAADSAGQLYAAGWSNTQAVVLRSSDLGATWTQVFVASSAYGTVRPTAPAFDAAGNVFVALRSPELVQIDRRTTDTRDTWLVYRGVPDASTPGGLSWSQVDRYRLAPTGASLPQAVVVRHPPNSGSPDEVFVGGMAVDDGGTHWIVRKSVDGGTTWSTVSNFKLDPKADGILWNWISSMTVDQAGVLYAAGGIYKMLDKRTSEPGWLVRKSLDGGVTWSNLDYVSQGQAAYVGVDAYGRVFVAGSQLVKTASGSYFDWVVRGSSDGGQTWVTTDVQSPYRAAKGVAGDAFGNVFVCGFSTGNSSGTGYVRKLAAP